MEIIKIISQILATVLGCLAALTSLFILLRLQWPAPILWIVKLIVSALSPLFFLIGVLSVFVGLTTGSVSISLIGVYDGLFFLLYIVRVTRPPDVSNGFEQAFGLNWKSQISAEQKGHFLPRRTIIRLPAVPIPRLEQDISFATIPGTDRQLLCDIWQPNTTVIPSGLAFIYLHGSAWSLLDKDVGTRPFFSHLAAQGHVIMDVAYRLAPETDMMGMVNDVKRAIVWMKENARRYGVHPNTIVVGGGSAGGPSCPAGCLYSQQSAVYARRTSGRGYQRMRCCFPLWPNRFRGHVLPHQPAAYHPLNAWLGKKSVACSIARMAD